MLVRPRSVGVAGTPGDVLDDGVWRLCRRPKQLGDALFWCAVAGCAVAAARGEARWASGILPGLFVDACIDAPLADRRMALRRDRIKNWMAWSALTPAFLPTPASLRRFLAGRRE